MTPTSSREPERPKNANENPRATRAQNVGLKILNQKSTDTSCSCTIETYIIIKIVPQVCTLQR